MNSLVGQEIGRYRILEQVGRGGMAVVYKAYDQRLDTNVAVKFIRIEAIQDEQSEQLMQRFVREARAQASLTHPNIVKVTDYGEFNDMPYLVMPFLVGGSLKDRLGEPIQSTDAAKLLLPVARALAYAHEKGFVHRDVKPANIFLTETGDVMLADFGVAKLLEGDRSTPLTATGVGIGTPEYMAPEQAMGQVIDGRADVYALGVVHYEMIAGRRPFEADTPMAVVIKHISDPLPNPTRFVPGLPEAVTQVVMRALAKSPDDRYPDMNAYAAALEKLAQGNETPQLNVRAPLRPASTLDLKNTALPGTPPAGRKIPPWAWLTGCLAGVFLLALLILGGWMVARSQANQQSTQTAEQNATAAMASVAQTESTRPTASAGPQAMLQPTATNASTPTLPPQATVTSTEMYFKDGIGVPMVLIPAGSFQMGNNSEESNESPVHTVNLDSFYLDTYEVTNEKYAVCVQDGSCMVPTSLRSPTRGKYYGQASFADYPVVYVNWEMARTYCAWRGARLPTEAEWEKAARGGLEGKQFPWGDALPTCEMGALQGVNSSECATGDTLPVGSYLPNAYGLYDMLGNVWEWTSSLFWPYPYKPDDGRENAGASDLRVLRGGSWYSRSALLRISNRYEAKEDYSDFNVGIRCACTP